MHMHARTHKRPRDQAVPEFRVQGLVRVQGAQKTSRSSCACCSCLSCVKSSPDEYAVACPERELSRACSLALVRARPAMRPPVPPPDRNSGKSASEVYLL
jgi:hypothetical protein